MEAVGAGELPGLAGLRGRDARRPLRGHGLLRGLLLGLLGLWRLNRLRRLRKLRHGHSRGRSSSLGVALAFWAAALLEEPRSAARGLAAQGVRPPAGRARGPREARRPQERVHLPQPFNLKNIFIVRCPRRSGRTRWCLWCPPHCPGSR